MTWRNIEKMRPAVLRQVLRPLLAPRCQVMPPLSPASWSSHRMLQAPSFSSASSDRVTVTLIPGDGVGPEMMDSCQEVLQSMGARLDFEPIYFSEVRKFE